MPNEPIAARLLRVFLGELGEQLRAMSVELLALERVPEDAERLRSLFRVVHTLKGAGAAAGVPMVADVCHGLEALLAQARAGTRVLGRSEFDWLLAAIDALDDARRRLAAGEALAGSPLEELARALRADPRAVAAPPSTSAEVSRRSGGRARPDEAPVSAPAARRSDEQVRVPVERLETLRALARRLVLAERRVQARAREAAALHELCLSGLGGASGTTWEGERAGALARSVLRLTQGLGTDARALGPVTAEVTEIADRLLTRPLGDAMQPLVRIVRDAAAATGKHARLLAVGDDLEADRRVLDALRESLPHLVRNAVDHGIEPHAERARAGKPETGTIRVTAAVRGGELTVTVADDGAGIDVAAVRAQLAQRGTPVPDDEAVALAAVFESGLSTRVEPTTTSGRGVGLDAVRSAVTRAGGTVHVASKPGAGTTFTLTCPLDLALVRALVFSATQRLLAVPSAAVEHLIRLDPDRIHRSQDRNVVSVPTAAAPVPLVSLGRLFGTGAGRDAAERNAVVLAVGGRRLAIAATELLSEEELVVRPAPQIDAVLPYLGGAALVGDRVALVLNAPALIDAGLALAPIGAVQTAAASRQRVLVVDDSITTRMLQQSVLEGAGYDVVTAVDGAAGWQILEADGADVVVADVEMPRMDGFALCEAIRASSRFRDLPVVLVTAAESPEHRARGMEAGADAYLGKSSFDQGALLGTIRRLVEDA